MATSRTSGVLSSWQGLVDFADELINPASLAALGVLALCLLVAGLVVRQLHRRWPAPGIALGERGWDGMLFPLLALALAFVGQALMKGHVPVAVFRVALPLLTALVIIRGVARVLHRAWPDSQLVRVLERTISWVVWVLMVLWITDLLAPLQEQMESVTWKIAGAPVTLRSLFEGVVSAGVVLLLALWLSAVIEARLMRAERVHLSVRKIAANATRAALLLVGLLTALSAAGIPLGALSVLGGAVGVGLGFGLQKLAANYVSGFVILAEQSLRIGDVVKVDNFEGRITDITTRYTVIRAPNGRESIVPNELLITQRVENSSLADPKVVVATPVQVAYGTDLDALTPLLLEAMRTVPRVLQDPGPAVLLSGFGASGLDLNCIFWIADLDKGEGGVRSDVNRAILRTLNAHGVEIPFPQMVLRRPTPAAPGPADMPAAPPAAPAPPVAPPTDDA